MIFDSHLHTPLCGHAVDWPEDYVRVASERGIQVITFTCHMPIDTAGFGGPGIRMPESEWQRYLDLVEGARELGAELGVEVLRGIEAEIFPDHSLIEASLERIREANLDFVLGSLHHQLPIYQDSLERRGCFSDEDKVKCYYEDLFHAMEYGPYHSIAHLDVIRLYGTLENAYDPAPYEAEIRACLEKARQLGLCIEINTSGLAKGDYVVHPDPLVMGWMRDCGNSLTMGSDSHHADALGRFFPEVLADLQDRGFTSTLLFREGKSHDVPIVKTLEKFAK